MGLRAISKKSCRLIANGNWTSPDIGFPDAADNAGTGAMLHAPKGFSIRRKGEFPGPREKVRPGVGKDRADRRVSVFALRAAPGRNMSREFHACRFTARCAAVQ